MKKCDYCGKNVSMPYTCKRCNGDFCSKHRLPENHDCPGLKRGGKDSKQIISDIKSQKSKKSLDSYKQNISNKAEGNMWAVFLAIIGFTYILQLASLVLFGEKGHNSLFVLNATDIEYFWTIITSIFSHSTNSLMHIIGNGIILLFFGRILEKHIGSKNFTYLFLFAGIIAGLSQISLNVLLSTPEIGVLGASGALLAVMGTLTVYNPKMKIYLYFIVPIPLWLITIGYLILSIVAMASMGSLMGNIAHMAHLTGLIIGIIYGFKTQHKYNLPNQIKRM